MLKNRKAKFYIKKFIFATKGEAFREPILSFTMLSFRHNKLLPQLGVHNILVKGKGFAGKRPNIDFGGNAQCRDLVTQ